MGMKAIPAVTTVALTIEERRGLEALAGSFKSGARMRDPARIVLPAASGIGSRALWECQDQIICQRHQARIHM